MSDPVDFAQDLEAEFREKALAASRQQVREGGLGPKDCQICGDEIPEARRQVSDSPHCVPCQVDIERGRR